MGFLSLFIFIGVAILGTAHSRLLGKPDSLPTEPDAFTSYSRQTPGRDKITFYNYSILFLAYIMFFLTYLCLYMMFFILYGLMRVVYTFVLPQGRQFYVH